MTLGFSALCPIRGRVPVGLSATDFLHFLIAFALLLAVARGLGDLARRLGQPSVIGELLAGVVLGPTLLGAAVPGVTRALFPDAGQEAVLLQLIAQLGVVFLLLLSGMEANLEVVRRSARAAVMIAAAGIIVPFLAGFGLALLVPSRLIGQPAQTVVFAFFVATAISMSAIPVIVKILIDLDLMRRDVGQLILAAGMLTDSAGWFLLALVAAAASAEALPLTALGVSFLGTLVFAVFAFTVGTTALRRLLAWVDHHVRGEDALLAAVLIVGLLGAALTQALHVEAFLGAFLVGVQLSRIPRVHRKARAQVEAMTLGVFAPIFFATAGLRVDVGSIVSPDLLLVTFVVIVVACVGKVAGAFAGARLAGLSPWLSLALGAGLNARGAVEIIVATIGLQLGILTPAMYSIVVVMAVATSLLAPPALRWTLKHVPAEPQEEERLRREALHARSFLHGVGRVLVPVRDGRYALPAMRIVGHLAGEREVDVVALHVEDDRGGAMGQESGVGRIGDAGARSDDAAVRADGDVGKHASRPSRPDLSAKFYAENVAGNTASGVGTVGDPADPPAGASAASSGEHVRWHARSVEAKEDVVSTVLAEAGRGYDLLVLGAAGRPPLQGLFGGVTDRLIVASPCPVFVLRLPASTADYQVRRVILPTEGTEDDQLAAEFAVALAKGTGAEVLALHVVEMNPLADPFWRSEVTRESSVRYSVGQYATKTVQSLGELLGVTVHSQVRAHAGISVEREIVGQANVLAGDLILLAARRRLAGSGLYCGRTVEYVLQNARCPVAVLFTTPAHGLELI